MSHFQSLYLHGLMSDGLIKEVKAMSNGYYNVAGCDHYMVDTTCVCDSETTYMCKRCGYVEKSSKLTVNEITIEVKRENNDREN